ncbi:MAG: hypothetical protein L3J49_01950, partial [Desulfobulbaceae bacterium]|nr:hypothetical protein [Desulfobulbaceae bacterium]
LAKPLIKQDSLRKASEISSGFSGKPVASFRVTGCPARTWMSGPGVPGLFFQVNMLHYSLRIITSQIL